MNYTVDYKEITVNCADLRPGPYQKRLRFEPGSLLMLAETLRDGLINPPVVTPELEILAGERRWRALCILALEQHNVAPVEAAQICANGVPLGDERLTCVSFTVKVAQDVSHHRIIAAVDNLQRENLTEYETACEVAEYRKVTEATDDDVIQELGITRNRLKYLLKLADVSPDIQRLYDRPDQIVPRDVLFVAKLEALSEAERQEFVELIETHHARLTLGTITATLNKMVPDLRKLRKTGKRIPAKSTRPRVPVAEAQPIKLYRPRPKTYDLDLNSARVLHRLLEESCNECRAHGFSARCLKCDGFAEFANRLVPMLEATYDVCQADEQ